MKVGEVSGDCKSVGLGKDTIVGCINEGVFCPKNAGGILSSTGYYDGETRTPLQDHAYEGFSEDCENRGGVYKKENVGGII